MSITITLSKPLPTTKGSKVGELTLREPTYDDYATLGDPRLPVIVNDKVVLQKLPDVIRLYAERLIEGSVVVTALGALPLEDGLKIERVILGFFAAADGVRLGEEPPASPDANG